MSPYSFIFIFMQKLLEKRDPDSIFAASTFVTLVQVVHFLLVFALFRLLFNQLSLPIFSETYFYNKLAMMPFGFIWMIAVYWYYSKFYSKIITAYEGRRILTIGNGLIVFSALVIPLIIAIQLSIKN
jgi:hypothetical protein